MRDLSHRLTRSEWEECVYLDIADELSPTDWDDAGAGPLTMDDLDPEWIKEAKSAADRLDLPWPPIPDFDLARDAIREAHRRRSECEVCGRPDGQHLDGCTTEYRRSVGVYR